ncbi:MULTISPECIES: HD-GYP domain-containing protein [unclassified Leisingera]|uniref:HD-GYP domain-containing protein n=1 Tax=unclassified Leisingera TaxID=2614906 RepID=UPI0002EADE78|nr:MULTISPECIES: HD-GYP domain-containing protein [unclassified Leisingera]KIC19123.1 metal-dependent phosphohydrolase [Leisingera sp. ANG-DT]KIC26470.1 metal-dependent phosphohydrolase [Leisingera sp. ANG-S3]KIC52789.1 metal-dependent phosphohydrolase [Leisingera sp. ANG-S]KID10186.1 metal-dependent phosphohydrolase [Leisingera sp. ANG1]
MTHYTSPYSPGQAGTAAPQDILRLGELLGALSHALDLTEGQPKGHCVRCCWIGMQVAAELGLAPQARSDLYFTLLMKDLGCSSNAARICQLYMADDLSFKRSFKTVSGVRQGLAFLWRNTAANAAPWTRLKTLKQVLAKNTEIAGELIETRCNRGAAIARQMRFSEDVAEGIACLDEHWDGGGQPLGLKGEAIPLFARIALMAQVADVFATDLGAEAAAEELERRAGSWFDPDLVPVFTAVLRRPRFLPDLQDPGLEAEVFATPQAQHIHAVDEEYLDEIARAFSLVIDAKSPFTHGHSQRVARYTGMICDQLEYTPERRRWMVRGALLHDIGKLGISNTILDKPGKMTDEEFALMKRHPVLGHEVLSRIHAFRELADVSAAHHERLDGKGYPYGLDASRLTQEMRVMAVADIFDALTADRPYRAALPLEKTYAIMDDLAGPGIDPDCYAALQDAVTASGWPSASDAPLTGGEWELPAAERSA